MDLSVSLHEQAGNLSSSTSTQILGWQSGSLSVFTETALPPAPVSPLSSYPKWKVKVYLLTRSLNKSLNCEPHVSYAIGQSASSLEEEAFFLLEEINPMNRFTH